MSDEYSRIWWNEAVDQHSHVSTVRFAGGAEFIRADRITALEAENARLREAAERAARYADGIRGAVETNQVADKDVRSVAICIRDNLRAALSQKEGSHATKEPT